MNTSLMPTPKQQYFAIGGIPLVGGKIYTYAAGTTNPKPTYSDATGTTAQPNPIVLNARGEPASAIFWSGSYRVDVRDALGNLIYSVDNYTDPVSAVNAVLNGLQLADYAALRAYTGTQTMTYVTGYLSTAKSTGVAGIFVRDDSDTTSADNGGTIIVAGNGTRWKRQYQGPVQVTWFGAKGDGNAFDSDAIDAALAASQWVAFSKGQFRISRPIIFLNQRIEGLVDNGALSTGLNQTMILADGTFPAFQYKHPQGYNSQGGAIRNFNIFFADGAEPAVDARPNAIGFLCDGTAGYHSHCVIENITIRGSQWGIFDKSGSWMVSYRHIHSEDCVGGIYKSGGTTHTFEACYHRNGKGGFHFYDCIGVVMNTCAVDLCTIDTPGYSPLFVENSNVVINGGDWEGNKLVNNYAEVMRCNGPNGYLHLNGVRLLGTTVTAGVEKYLIRATGTAAIRATGVDTTNTEYIGNGGVLAMFASIGFSSISVDQAVLPAVEQGTPGTAFAGLATDGTITYDNALGPYAWSGACRRVEKSLRFSFVLDVPPIPAGQSAQYTYDTPGSVVGDFVQAALESGVGAAITTAWVNAANQSTVRFYNPTDNAMSIDPPQTNLRLKITQQ